MCGGFVGEGLEKLDVTGTFKKTNPHEVKKRKEAEAIANADKEAAAARAKDLADRTLSNQAVQAASVANRRRRGAQSLLRAAGPGAQADEAGNSVLSRALSYAATPSLG